MAQSKTWTAHDVKQGHTSLDKYDGLVHVTQQYWFVDDSGPPPAAVEGLEVKTITFSEAVSYYPTAVMTAMQTIRDWLYDEILSVEGMEDP